MWDLRAAWIIVSLLTWVSRLSLYLGENRSIEPILIQPEKGLNRICGTNEWVKYAPRGRKSSFVFTKPQIMLILLSTKNGEMEHLLKPTKGLLRLEEMTWKVRLYSHAAWNKGQWGFKCLTCDGVEIISISANRQTNWLTANVPIICLCTINVVLFPVR